MKPAACTTCGSPHTAPCGPSHKANGLHTFCLKCRTFYDIDGNAATASDQEIRNTIASRIVKARADLAGDNALDGLADVIRNGGRLG